jgi:hypothetical protein
MPAERGRRRHTRLAKSGLPFRYKAENGFVWWLLDERFKSAAETVSAHACSSALDLEPLDEVVLKHSDRRLVFRTGQGDGRAVAKVFQLPRLEDRLRYERFGLDEAANLQRAEALGIPVPRVYGYGHRRTRYLVSVSAVLMEDLADYRPAGQLLSAKAGSDAEVAEVLSHTIPVFVELYAKGCNHIDVNIDAVMLPVKDRSLPPCILDLQHAVFLELPSAEVLMAQAGRFASRHDQFKQAFLEWLEQLLDAVAISGSMERARLRERFEFYRDSDLSREQRRGIR